MHYHYYQLYGLVLQSQIAIPQLLPVNQQGKANVVLDFHEQETSKCYAFQAEARQLHQSPGLARNAIPHLTVWKQSSVSPQLVIRYSNGVQTCFFTIDETGTAVNVYHPKTMSTQDILTYFLGPVIGCILRLKHQICLHASVVNIAGKAVALIGQKGAGKSTLTLAFAALGYPILSDDIAVLYAAEEAYFVHLGYPSLRLWKKSVQHFPTIPVENLQPIVSNAEKYYLPLSIKAEQQWKFQAEPLPLQHIYYLSPRKPETGCQLKACTPMEAFLKLKGNVYADYMLNAKLKAKSLHIFSQLANQNRVKILERPDDLNFLATCCQLIVEDVSP